MIGDFAYNYVPLLLHGDGADSGTVFPDSSGAPKTITTVGGPITAVAAKKFGTASIYFNASSSLGISNPLSFEMGGGDLTLEMFVRAVNTSDSHLCGKSTAGATYSLAISSVSGKFKAYFDSNNTALDALGAYTSAVWYHLALVRYGDTGLFFIDGALQQSIALSGSLLSLPSDAFYVGKRGAYTGTPFTGYLDEIRVTKGLARYTAAFTPPTAAFYSFLPVTHRSLQQVPRIARSSNLPFNHIGL